MPKRKKKKYSKPKRMFDKERIEEENKLIKKYGLKNKREIWKAETYVDKIRKRAKETITKREEQEELFKKLEKIGIKVKSIADILALNKEDILKRRLQTVLFNKKMAKTIKHARQLIAHKHVKVGGKVISSPSYIVKLEEEDKIEVI